MKNHVPFFIEPLETRIAPAGLLTFIDVDGDEAFIQTSQGSDANLWVRI
ncbi:MAG TPA: hypothetical protein VF614_12475 [Chthoniobacteraceae bacterium]|jgi:hypothetical protein